ncbi:MAG: hypothetical protein Tsb0013_09640 [Phycisphaerales bacterium]
MVRTTALMFAAGVVMTTTAANAYVNTMYSVGFEPSTIGTQIASLDSSAYDYNDPANLDAGRLDSGFTADVLDGGGNPIFETDRTTLITNVYRVDTPTTLTDTDGNLNLEAGDLIFAYTIDLVGASANAVDTLSNFNIFASTISEPFNSDIFDGSIIKGRGFTTAGLTNGTGAVPVEQAFDFGTVGTFLSTLDWAFPAAQASQMQNSESITFLMFSRPASVEVGLSGFSGEPGQAPATTDSTANGVPILVPIVPAPGAFALAGVAGLTLITRRRSA